MHTDQCRRDVTRYLLLDEGGEACERLELRWENVEKWRCEDVLTLDVRHLRVDSRRVTLLGGVYTPLSRSDAERVRRKSDDVPSCRQTNASRQRTSRSSPTLSRNSLSVASVRKVSLRILLYIGEGLRELFSRFQEEQVGEKISDGRRKRAERGAHEVLVRLGIQERVDVAVGARGEDMEVQEELPDERAKGHALVAFR